VQIGSEIERRARNRPAAVQFSGLIGGGEKSDGGAVHLDGGAEDSATAWQPQRGQLDLPELGAKVAEPRAANRGSMRIGIAKREDSTPRHHWLWSSPAPHESPESGIAELFLLPALLGAKHP
jgi:hypothetical protein